MLVPFFLFSCKSSAPPEFDEAAWLAKVKAEKLSSVYAPHIKENGTFFNPWMERPRISGRNWRNSSKQVFDDFPEEKYSHVENSYAYLADRNYDSISYAGHASIIIKMNGETIITDPFFSDYAFIAGKKVKLKFDYSKVPEKPIVLISHNHYDHLDKESVKKLIKKSAVFFVPLKLKDFFTRLGAKEVYELDWWDSVRLGEITYTFLPAQHWSMRIGQPGGSTLWGGFLIQGRRTVYFSGDTGYFCGFGEFGRRYGIDYALLGVGAYEPRWFMHYQHMNVPEFFDAAAETGAGISIPMHFGLVSLSDEPITYPLFEIDEYIKEKTEFAQSIRPLRVGEFFKMEE